VNPIRVVVEPSRRWFGGRGQYKFRILAGNGEPLDARDTYSNVGDIRAVMQQLVNSDTPVVLEAHYRSGAITETVLR
jgi:hypothetical protein